MKTILLATDFSENAHWAVDYAVEMAFALHAQLVILNAYDPLPVNTPAHEWLTSADEGAKQACLHRLHDLRDSIREQTGGLLLVDVVARPGDPAACIAAEVRDRKPDLLVMGLVGDEPYRARIEGSLATQLIPETLVSMLLVPPGTVYAPIRSVVLAVDLDEPVDVLTLGNVKRFARLLDATLDIVCVEDTPTDLHRWGAEAIRNLFVDQPHTFQFLSGNDLTVALDSYFAQTRADLIVLLPKRHSRFRVWLTESVTQQVARQAIVPVLAVV